MNTLYGENRFYRHVASHWIEMQQALVAMIIGGVFEFHPNLRVGFLEAQNSWAPGLLSRIEWDYPQYQQTHAPYLSLTPKEYFQRNCWAAVEGSEPEIEATASLIGADRMCISTDYPHFDSNFPNVSNNLLQGRIERDSGGHPLRRRDALQLRREGFRESGRGQANRGGCGSPLITRFRLQIAAAALVIVVLGLSGYGIAVYLGFFSVPLVSKPAEHSARYYPGRRCLLLMDDTEPRRRAASAHDADVGTYTGSANRS